MTRNSAVAGTHRVGRNDACPCGSGKKYKKCCMQAAGSNETGLQAASAPENAHYELGAALLQQGKLNEAAGSFSTALKIRPDFYQAIDALGVVLQKAGRLEQSVVCYRKAISLAPGYVSAHHNLGLALHALGRWDEAIASYRQALQYEPAFAAAYANMGNAFVARGDFGDFEDGVRCCEKAIELEPGLVLAHLFLGNACKTQGLLSRAIDCYRQAISLTPGDAVSINNLGELFKEQCRLPEAIAAYRRALAIQPDYAIAYSNLLYLQSFTRNISPEAERLLAEGWERAALAPTDRADAREQAVAFPARPLGSRKLRLGIVSADLGDHPVSEFLQPFLEQLDCSRFHLTLFPTFLRRGERASRMLKFADSCISLVDAGDQQAVERIRAEEIDVLMDLSGHTGGGRLGIFARRAAPVQCTHLGYWSTTGLSEMDWFIADIYGPASLDAHFTEGLWRLPRLAYCYAGDDSIPADGWQPGPDGTVWLGSFNKFGKIGEQTLALWAAVLNAVPEAKLLFEDRQPNENENHQRISATLAGHGIAEDRVSFIPYVAGHTRHMLMYNRLDIALDTIPFNSGTTAYDALWMGVPLLTLQGDWFGGILTTSVLKAFGREEWIAQNTEEYVSIVRSLARDVEGRRTIRETQRARMAASPLCDSTGMARSLEEAFEAMYTLWMRTASPATYNGHNDNAESLRGDKLVTIL